MSQGPGNKDSAAAQIILGFLATLFGLAALGLAALAVQHFRTESESAWGVLAFCVVLGVVAAVFGGVSMLAAADRRKRQAIASRRALQPNEPWLWAEEWRQGRIQSVRGRSAAAVLIIFAGFWNAMVVGAAFAASRQYDVLHTPSIWIFLLIFGLAGLFLVGLAVYMTLLAKKYDPAIFEMSHLPGVLGGSMSGTIRLPPQLPAGVEVHVELACDRTSGSGKSRTSHCLWQDTTRGRALPGGCLPIAFTIPFDLPPSDTPGAEKSATTQWWLRAKASVPGVDYNAIFEVPVFSTGASDRSIAAGTVDPSRPAARPPNAKSNVLECGLERTVVALAPAKGMGCGITALILFPLLAWSIGRYAQLEPELTVMLYGAAIFLSCGTVVLVCAGLLLTAVRIEIDRDALRVPHGKGPLRWTRTIPLASIAEIKYVSSGSPPTQRIDLHTKDGRSYLIASDLSGLEEAKWLTAELTSAVERYRA